MSDSVYKEVLTGAPKITIKYYKPTNPAGRSFIPVEFAVAAYRFGHSITRPRYTVRDVFDSTGTLLGSVSGVPLFEDAPTDNNLNGHRELLPRLKIQWSKFFNVETGDEPYCPARAPVRRFAGQSAVQAAPTALPDTNTLGLLSQRNLRRGRKMGLPSGQQVARLMGVTPLTNAQLSTEPPHQGDDPDRRQRGEASSRRVRRGRTQSLKRPLRESGMGRRGPAVVLHPEGGRDRRQGPRSWGPSAGGSWPRFSSVCCKRTPTRTCT